MPRVRHLVDAPVRGGQDLHVAPRGGQARRSRALNRHTPQGGACRPGPTPFGLRGLHSRRGRAGTICALLQDRSPYLQEPITTTVLETLNWTEPAHAVHRRAIYAETGAHTGRAVQDAQRGTSRATRVMLPMPDAAAVRR